MSEQSERAAVVQEALSWVGTRFKDHSRVKIKRDAEGRVSERGGVDCAQFLYRVYHDLGLTAPMDPMVYSPQWYLHRDEERFLNTVAQRARETDTPLPGDMVIYKVGRCYAHGAIVVQWPRIVHAVALAGCVMEDTGDTGMMARRAKKFFTLWGA